MVSPTSPVPPSGGGHQRPGNSEVEPFREPCLVDDRPICLLLINQSLPSGTLTSRVTANDYNRNNFNFQAPGEHKIDFPQGKLDWVINSKHHWEATGGANPYRLFPDGINGVIPVFPGTPTGIRHVRAG